MKSNCRYGIATTLHYTTWRVQYSYIKLGVLISISEATEPVSEYLISHSLWHMADITLVTFPAKQHHHCRSAGNHFSHSTESRRQRWLVIHQDGIRGITTDISIDVMNNRLDYCNALLYGISDSLFRHLQSI